MNATELLSALDLAQTVNAWCDQHGVAPASGQAGQRITERNIRYYRSLGLLDPPDDPVPFLQTDFWETMAAVGWIAPFAVGTLVGRGEGTGADWRQSTWRG